MDSDSRAVPVLLDGINPQAFAYVNVYDLECMGWVIKYRGVSRILTEMVKYIRALPNLVPSERALCDDLQQAYDHYQSRYAAEEAEEDDE